MGKGKLKVNESFMRMSSDTLNKFKKREEEGECCAKQSLLE